jgi:hypothetical protein
VGGMTDSSRRAPTRQMTLVCSVLTEPARRGAFVGSIVVVATGESVPVRSVEELLELVQRLSTTD